MTDLTQEDKQFFREEIFRTRPSAPCDDCGGYHMRACPRVKRAVFVGQGAGAGNRTEVEYWEKWDDSNVIWPEEVWDDEEEDKNE